MTGGTYVLGHSDAELRRLEAQARVKDPITRRFLLEAGMGPGMRVLDVGSGAGDVALLLAELVGESGQVIGFDRSVVGIEAARAKVAERGMRNVSFVVGGPADLSFDEPFDAVVGRYVLQFQADPAAMIVELAAHAKPGAPILFYEWIGPVPVRCRRHPRMTASVGGASRRLNGPARAHTWDSRLLLRSPRLDCLSPCCAWRL